MHNYLLKFGLELNFNTKLIFLFIFYFLFSTKVKDSIINKNIFKKKKKNTNKKFNKKSVLWLVKKLIIKILKTKSKKRRNK